MFFTDHLHLHTSHPCVLPLFFSWFLSLLSTVFTSRPVWQTEEAMSECSLCRCLFTSTATWISQRRLLEAEVVWPGYENSPAETRAGDTHTRINSRKVKSWPSVNCSHIFSSAVLAPHRKWALVTIFSLDNQNPEIFHLRHNWRFVNHFLP